MSDQYLNMLLMADFTIDPLASYVKEVPGICPVKTKIAPLGQIIQTIYAAKAGFWEPRPDCVVIWTKPELQIPSFAALLEGEDVSIAMILAEVMNYSQLISQAAQKTSLVFVPSWSLPLYLRGNRIMDMKHNQGLNNILMQMNLHLSEQLSSLSNVHILNSHYWQAVVERPDEQKMWYLGKIPFTAQYFARAGQDIVDFLSNLYGNIRKLIVLDLDHTLWGGIIGDDGIEAIRLGGHDPVGEAYVEFQKRLLALKKRGILLAIASKNEESTALKAIADHPEMILKPKDFVAWRINWHDKAANIQAMVKELNLGLQSVVFIDDNPVERTRVSEALPEVLVPNWPEDPVTYVAALEELSCFNMAGVSNEDRQRTEMYQQSKQREKNKQQFVSLENWLHSLDLEVEFQSYDRQNRQRIVQLLNKTNQFNLVTRRLTEKEFDDFAARPDVELMTVHCRDRIGSYGMAGLVSFSLGSQEAVIQDFLMSCRVMGKQIEVAMLYATAQFALNQGKTRLRAFYIPTPKNKPLAHFLPENGFVQQENDYVHLDPAAITSPLFIKIKGLEAELLGSHT